MFYVFLTIAIIGMAILYVVSVIPSLQSQIWLVMVAQFIKSTGIIVATGYMWALVPEVISYGEHTTGRRISGIVNALTGIFIRLGWHLGCSTWSGVIFCRLRRKNAISQSPLVEQGILWLVVVIPALLLMLGMFIIKYELEDDVIDRINIEIEERHMSREND